MEILTENMSKVAVKESVDEEKNDGDAGNVVVPESPQLLKKQVEGSKSASITTISEKILRTSSHPLDFDVTLSHFRNKNTQSCNIEMKRLIRHISSKKMFFQEISFFDSLLGDREISAVVKLLKISPHLKKLDLSYNRFLIHGSRKIANCLSENGIANGKSCSLQTLILEGNQGIGPTGTAAFMSHIASNTCLTTLNIGTCQSCQFGWSFGIKNLAMCLNENKTLRNLDFSNNRISINQFDHRVVFENVCKSLKKSNIQNISFRQNNLNERGALLIANAIAENDSIESIDLSQCSIDHNGALGLSAAIVQRQTSKYPINALNLTGNIFFANDDALKALSTAMFTTRNGIRKLTLGGGNGRINNLNLNIGGGNEYHGDNAYYLNNQRFATTDHIHNFMQVEVQGNGMVQPVKTGLHHLIDALSLINESCTYTKILTLQGIDFQDSLSFRKLCNLLKPMNDVNANTGLKNNFKDEIQKSDKGNDIRRRRLIPYHDWDKRTLLQLEELHLDNTNLHENDFEALYDAIKINPLTKYRNSNLKKIYIDRRDYTKNIKNDYIKEELLKPVIIGYIPVDTSIIYCLINVLNRITIERKIEAFALPSELVIHIMKFLCTCEYRTVEVVGDIVEEEENNDGGEVNEDEEENANPFEGYLEGDGLFTNQRRQTSM